MTSELTEQIKDFARNLGFQAVGVTKAEYLPESAARLRKWLNTGRNATMNWIERRKDERFNVLNYFPEARSIISVGMNYFTENDKKIKGQPVRISRYSWGVDYHILIKERLLKLVEKIRNAKPGVKTVVCVDTAPIMEKAWAQQAGLGWQGKHTNLISRDYGSWLFLGEVIIDEKLEYDKPFADDLCGTCSACIDACPTAALTDYEIDASKCISYLTIEHRDAFNKDEQKAVQDWIFGCDICQNVCPWNIKNQIVSRESMFQPKPEITKRSLSDWLILTEDDFSSIFKDSAVKRAKFAGLKRNIAAVKNNVITFEKEKPQS
jgi:epoxyqueuosine reductase